MTTVRNPSRANLTLPGGRKLPAGGMIALSANDWAKIENASTVRSWLAAGIIEIIVDDPPTKSKAKDKE